MRDLVYHHILLTDERPETLRDALIGLCVQLRSFEGPPAIVRTDSAPGFKALVDDVSLCHHGIAIEIGDATNRNKNPVAERSIQELENELLRQDPLGGPVSLTCPLLLPHLTLMQAFAHVVCPLRRCGLNDTSFLTNRSRYKTETSFCDSPIILIALSQKHLSLGLAY